jgi:hypothetical protein
LPELDTKEYRASKNESDPHFFYGTSALSQKKFKMIKKKRRNRFSAGQTYYITNSTKFEVIKDYKYNNEIQIELYCNFMVNDYVIIAPSIQYFRSEIS